MLSEAFQHLSAQHAFLIVLHGDEIYALTVRRFSNTTSDAMLQAESPTEALLRLQGSVSGVFNFL